MAIRRQPVDVSRVEPGEQRGDRPIGGLVAEPATEQLPQRLLDTVAALPLHEIRERPQATPSREARPAEHIADVARDPEGRVAQVRHEAGVGPEERAGRARRDQRQTEIPAERDPPGLPRGQRIGAGLQLEVADRHGRRDRRRRACPLVRAPRAPAPARWSRNAVASPAMPPPTTATRGVTAPRPRPGDPAARPTGRRGTRGRRSASRYARTGCPRPRRSIFASMSRS